MFINKLAKKNLFILFFLLGFSINISAETVALIGTGSVSSALGPRISNLGHKVIYGSRNPQSDSVKLLVEKTGPNSSATSQNLAAQDAQIVIIAVPWNVAEEVVRNLGDLSGKIIIDPINPRVISDDGFADYPSNMSISEKIQNLAPEAKVVKAFNTLGADTMANPDLVKYPITIPVVGNDRSAKLTVMALIKALGFDSVDLGPIRFAHIVEGFYLLRANARLYGQYFEWYLFPATTREQYSGPDNVKF